MGLEIRDKLGRASDRLNGRRRVHLLHIGKTGGTALKAAIRPHAKTDRYRIVLHDHVPKLADVPVGDRFVFILRDPVTRFVSAFRSAQRRGQPRYFEPWSDDERTAFKRFKSPDALASALADTEDELRGAAETAMRAIRHIRSRYWDWFESEAYLRSRLDDLFYIGFQETLAGDFEALKQRLGLPMDLVLPTDERSAHRSPMIGDNTLSDAAAAKLTEWYAADYEFIEFCRGIMAERNTD